MRRSSTFVIMAALVCCLLTGCSLKNYYQVYQTSPVNDGQCQIRDGMLVHETNDYTVSYNFFAEEGNPGFYFTNNTDSVIFIELGESFFILNGMTNDYFQLREYTTTKSQTLNSSTQSGKTTKKNKRSMLSTSGSSATSTKATTYTENRLLIIPPHATRYYSDYHIQLTKMEICGMKETPSKGKPSGKSYTLEDSPITFGNFLTYHVGVKGARKYCDDRFYVSQINNVNRKSMLGEGREKDACGKEKGEKFVKMTWASPDRFYIVYKK